MNTEKKLETTETSEQVTSEQPGNAPAASAENTCSSTKQRSAVSRFFSFIWKDLISRKFFQKILTLFFSFVVFGYAYKTNIWHRNELVFIGFMLLMVFVYIELLIIRDHLWVIEGSMREAKRWRQVFFNQSSLSQQRLRKYATIILSAGVFSYLYHTQINSDFPQESGLVFFVGSMLMITILYYEILIIRDEVITISNSINQKEKTPEDLKKEEEFDQFLNSGKNGKSEVPSVDETGSSEPVKSTEPADKEPGRS